MNSKQTFTASGGAVSGGTSLVVGNLSGIAHPTAAFKRMFGPILKQLADERPVSTTETSNVSKPTVLDVIDRANAISSLASVIQASIESNAKDGRVDCRAVANEVFETLERHQKNPELVDRHLHLLKKR